MTDRTPPAGAFERARAALRGAALALVGALALGADAEARQSTRPDQLFVRSRRDGSIAPVLGVVQKYELSKVVVINAGKEQTFDGNQVTRVVWGDVPPSYRDGRAYFERGAWEDAVKSLRVAAGDASAREMVKAAAKRMTAQALLAWGAGDPTRFTEAANECAGYLTSFAQNRDVPSVRMLHARALWLSGKPAEAGAAYKGVHAELKGDTVGDGYEKLLCVQAGIQAARALLDAKDTLGAREIYSALEAQAGPLAAATPATEALHHQFQAVVDEAALGAGFVDLAAGQPRQALTFFQNKVGALNAESTPAQRYGARLGLGEALLADNRVREASLELARVAALDPLDRDRAARASVKLAECFSKLADGDARQQACVRLKEVLARAGDTPAAVRARQLVKELGC